MTISPARTIAFDVLRNVATHDAYADETLRAALAETVGTADAGLATELTMGVLRWQRLLDFLIDRNLAKKIKLLDPEVRIALRMGVYQLCFLKRVPAHAAVNESVELVKKARKRSAGPLVNAVLRKAAKEQIPAGAPGASFVSLLLKDLPLAETLGIEHSHPTWLVERWLQTFGEERTRALLEANNRVPTNSSFMLQPERRDAAMTSLLKAGFEVKPGNLLRNSWTLDHGNPAASEAMLHGWIAIQDEASQAVAHLLGVHHGDSVLDLCAAPGGKTLLLSLAAGPQGKVTATDVHPRRVRAMAERFERAGVRNVETIVLDGTRPLPFDPRFDRILVDAPCSGTGTLARHPEIRWTLRAQDLADLHARQVSLLRSALPFLAPDGKLVYSTCSLEAEENETVVTEALGSFQTEFRTVLPQETLRRILRDGMAPENLIRADGFFRTFPSENATDGFFAAVIERGAIKP